MEYVIYLLKIIAYFAICRIIYVMSKKSYRKKGIRLTWVVLILGTVLLSIYSIYITNPNLSLSHDRQNYYIRYSEGYDISLSSVGLNWVYELLRPISLDASFFWFSIAFIFVSISLVAYKYYKQATPYALLFLLCSSFYIFGYAAMKQSIANSFACLSFMCYFNMPYIEKTPKKVISALCIIVTTILAIVFHEAAFLLIVVYLALSVWNNKILRNIGWVVMIGVVIAFPLITSALYGDIGQISESLEEQTASYAEHENGAEGNVMTILKGLPFYIFTFVGFVRRKYLLCRIVNYDKYLLLAALVSLTTIVSMFNYWYFRFGMLLYLPVFVFAVSLYGQIKKGDKYRTWLKISFISLVLLSLKTLVQYYFLYGGI